MIVSDDYDETKPVLTEKPRTAPVNPYWKGEEKPRFEDVPDGASITIRDYENFYNDGSWVFAKYKEPEMIGGFHFMEEIQDPSAPVDVELVLNSVAAIFKKEGKKGIQISYYQSYTPEEFENLAL